MAGPHPNEVLSSSRSSRSSPSSSPPAASLAASATMLPRSLSPGAGSVTGKRGSVASVLAMCSFSSKLDSML